jgi:hypothetical protein
VKALVPVIGIAISADRALKYMNIPWIFRLLKGTPPQQALDGIPAAMDQAGSNRGRICELLASETNGEAFDSIQAGRLDNRPA